MVCEKVRMSMGTVLIDTSQRLAFPFGERKQPEGLTEEVFGLLFAEKNEKTAKQETSPDLAAPLPSPKGRASSVNENRPH